MSERFNPQSGKPYTKPTAEHGIVHAHWAEENIIPHKDWISSLAVIQSALYFMAMQSSDPEASECFRNGGDALGQALPAMAQLHALSLEYEDFNGWLDDVVKKLMAEPFGIMYTVNPDHRRVINFSDFSKAH